MTVELDNCPNEPSLLRKALCELTGGHANIVLTATHNGEVIAIRLRCVRCLRQTPWYSMPPVALSEPEV
jgi:hypothetical protein